MVSAVVRGGSDSETRMIKIVAELDLKDATIIAAVERAQLEAGKTAARRLIARAKSRTPRDTGAMAEGWYYCAGDGESTYDQAVAAAKARKPDVVILPMRRPLLSHGVCVANVAAHWVYVEFGTTYMDPVAPLGDSLSEMATDYTNSFRPF